MTRETEMRDRLGHLLPHGLLDLGAGQRVFVAGYDGYFFGSGWSRGE